MDLNEKLIKLRNYPGRPGAYSLSRKDVQELRMVMSDDDVEEYYGCHINFDFRSPPGIHYEAKLKKKEAQKMQTYTATYGNNTWFIDQAFPPIVAYDDGSYKPISLDPFNWDPATAPQKEEKGNNPMYFHFNTSTPIENQQIEFAFQYAREAFDDAVKSLATKYHIHEPQAPKDAEEFIERIKAGKYTLLDKTAHTAWYNEFDSGDCDGEYYIPKRLRWRTEKADQDGYDAAYEALSTEFTKLKATIMANDYKASIAAVDDFSKKHTVH